MLHVSSLLVVASPHLPFTTSTSSSSFTLPSTTTQEHAAQPVQHEQLREHPVHHAHLQAPSVDKLRHQESLWRENLQSGGSPRTTTPTGFEPKELATVSRISGVIDPYQLYDAQKEFGEQDHRVPITEEVKEFGGIGTHSRPTSNPTCISTIPQKRRWRVTKDADFTHCMPESFWETRCIGRAGERAKCTIDSSRKIEFEVSFICMPESFGETRCIVFI